MNNEIVEVGKDQILLWEFKYSAVSERLCWFWKYHESFPEKEK